MQDDKNFTEFETAVFNVLKERGVLSQDPIVRLKMHYALGAMPKYWGRHNDRYHRIHNADVLGDKLATKLEAGR